MSGGVTLLMAFYFQNNEDGGRKVKNPCKLSSS